MATGFNGRRNGLGDGPIEESIREVMNSLAEALDRVLNSGRRKTGFILITFPFGTDGGRCNYISNAKRDDVVALLKHQISRYEGWPDTKGTA